jgi:cupin fold WbuC family metalloprotein
MLKGTYVRPHRHLTPPKAETFVVLEGRAAVIALDGGGGILSRSMLSPGECWGIDVPAGVWHTIAVLSDIAVCFEVKPGPWDPATDKEFAPWAPAEDDPAAAAYLNSLLAGLE